MQMLCARCQNDQGLEHSHCRQGDAADYSGALDAEERTDFHSSGLHVGEPDEQIGRDAGAHRLFGPLGHSLPDCRVDTGSVDYVQRQHPVVEGSNLFLESSESHSCVP